MTKLELTTPTAAAMLLPLTSPPSNPAIDSAELRRRLAALETVLGR